MDKAGSKPKQAIGSGTPEGFADNFNKLLQKNNDVEVNTLTGDKKFVNSSDRALLFSDCKIGRNGTNDNFGNGGSNSIQCVPEGIYELAGSFSRVFRNSKEGKLQHLNNYFLIPLCDLKKNPQLIDMAMELCAEFVSQQKGGIKHEYHHIANAMTTACVSIIYHISKELSKGPSLDEHRIIFLVTALRDIIECIKNAAEYPYNKTISKLFNYLPHVCNTCDVLQSIILMSIFKQTPANCIRVNWIALLFERFFKYHGVCSFVENQGGIFAVLLYIPLLFKYINTDAKIDFIVNKLIIATNNSIIEISKTIKDFRLIEDIDVHGQNLIIIEALVTNSGDSIIPLKPIIDIYKAVVVGETDILKTYGQMKFPDFIFRSTYTIASVVSTNEVLEIGNGRYIGATPHEWSAMDLNSNRDYELIVKPIGIAIFPKESTPGLMNIANIRLSMIDGNLGDILRGDYEGFSSSGMYYDPITSKYTKIGIVFNPEISFQIKTTHTGYTIEQNKIEILTISNNGNSRANILLCFKNCTVDIKRIPIIANCLSLGEELAKLKI